ncbi:MAG: alkaline phosphatase, partial [Hydrogenophaga sp.]|nr:alkaline phosphatase [Hydrogenophaga sp.]
MSHPHKSSRRQILQMLSGVPMLPLSSALGGSALLAACGGGEDGAIPKSGTAVSLESVSFSSMAAPDLSDAAAMATTSVDSVMTTHFSDGSQVDFELAYQPFFITGDTVAKLGGGTILAGGYVDIHGN